MRKKTTYKMDNMKKFLYLALVIGLGTESQRAAQQLAIQKTFVQQTKAVTPEGQELAKVLEEKTRFPPELAEIAVGYLEEKELKGTLEGTLDNKEAVRILLPLSEEILVSSSDGTLKIWDLKTKQLTRTIDAKIIEGGRITSLVKLSPNTFASGSNDGSIKIWNTEGKLLRILRELTVAANRVALPSTFLAVRHDGKLISARNSPSLSGFHLVLNIDITIWDQNSGIKIKETVLREKFVISLALAPSGNLVLAVLEHKTPEGSEPTKAFVMYLDPITLRELQSIALPKQRELIEIVVLPNGTIAASSSNAQSISILPPSARQGTSPEELSLPVTKGFISLFEKLAVLSHGRLASSHLSYNTQSDNYTYQFIIWNYDEKSNRWMPQLTLEGHKYGISSLAVLPDGRLISGDAGGVINIWEIKPT